MSVVGPRPCVTYALDVYNAMNDSAYTDPSVITIMRLENGISLSVRNDASFFISNYLNLYEHQSTYSPNAPLRFLIYLTNLLKTTIRKRDLYGRKRVQIATPHFAVFYNGTEKRPEKEVLKLSDGYLYSDKLCIKVLDLTQLEKAKQKPETNKKLLKWASIFKAETLEELEQLASGEEVFENMVVTMKKLSEDEKIRMQCEAREDYERSLLTEYNAGKSEGIEQGIQQGIASERGNTEKERQRAEKESQRAEKERQRAENESQRADTLAAEVERLRALLK